MILHKISILKILFQEDYNVIFAITKRLQRWWRVTVKNLPESVEEERIFTKFREQDSK